MESNLMESSAKEEVGPRRPATFQGTAYHKVSARHQVALPRHLLKTIVQAQEGQLLLMRWNNEGYLRMYTQKQMDKMIESILQREGLTNEDKADLTRSLSGSAVPIDPDSQGRFVLPSQWVEELGLRDEIAFCGFHKRIEIWPAEAHRDAKRLESERVAALAPKVKDILDL